MKKLAVIKSNDKDEKKAPKRLTSIKTKSDDSGEPVRIVVYHRDLKSGDFEEVGDISWDGKKWVLNGNDQCRWIQEDFLDNGTYFDGRMYTPEDRDFYVSLVETNMTSYAFKAEEN